jgi:amino acid transporter
VAANGGQGFTWLIFLAVFFFVPYALLTAELGSAFPEEGGPYIWPRLAFGRFIAALNTMIYWVANPIWVGGSLAILSIAAFSKFFTDITTNDPARYTFALIFIWFTIVSAIVSFRRGKWIPTIGAFARIIVLSFFTLSVVIYAFEHGLHGFGASNFKPTYTLFIALVPVLIFNYVGFELPNAAGEEMKDAQRDVPFAVLRSAIGTVLLYGGPILGVLLILPTSQITSLSGFLDAVKSVFTVYGGHIAADGTVTLTGAGKFFGWIAALAFIWAFATSGSTWIMGSDRTLAVACFDGVGPRILGRFSARFGTPIYVNIFSGIIATLLMVLAFHYSGNSTNKYFSVVLALAISTTTISYLAIFPALIKLRYSHPDVPRPYRIPFGAAGAWVCSILTEFWVVLATIVLIWPGLGVDWFGAKGDPNASLPSGFAAVVGKAGHAADRSGFELTQIVPLVILFALGVLFYILGTPTRRKVAEVPLLTEEPEGSPALA